MAMAKFTLKTLPGINRPAMAAVFPSQRSESVMLDLGANVECNADNLMEFSIMGAEFARTVLGLQDPSVGLLNVGSEEVKGHEAVRLAAAQLRERNSEFRYHGFVEGDDIASGTSVGMPGLGVPTTASLSSVTGALSSLGGAGTLNLPLAVFVSRSLACHIRKVGSMGSGGVHGVRWGGQYRDR